MVNLIKRHLGQILLDGGFLRKNDLDRAFEEQKHTKELLGQILVRMGVIKAQNIHAPLLVQEHLSSIDDAVKIAAGERQLLGALLVQSGQITSEQLDHAIAEQKRCGEKLGDVFMRLGMLTERQLSALLEFQQNQGDANTSGPLKLGELLVSTGHISREQLERALQKQIISHKKIGEVMVEEGYISANRIKSGFRLQKMLVSSVLAAILSLSLSAPVSASSVSLQWDPNTESDLAGYKVYYGVNGLASPDHIDVNNQTVATISGLDPAQNYSFAVAAYNTSGLEGPYSNVVTELESVLPVVSIYSPGNNAKVSNTVDVRASASDNVGVVKVEYYVNGTLKATNTAEPYLYSWDTHAVTPGTHSITAKAYDAAGNVSLSTISVNVVNDLAPPVISQTAPLQGSSVSGSVTVSCAASDDVGVTRVEFYVNGSMGAAVNTNPYNYVWDTMTVPNGSYTLTAKAYDAAGNIGQTGTVTVTVNNIALTPSSTANYTISDALFALRIAVGLVNPTQEQRVHADVSPVDGKIDISDALAILKDVVRTQKLVL